MFDAIIIWKQRGKNSKKGQKIFIGFCFNFLGARLHFKVKIRN